MILRIARKEFIELVRDGRLRVTATALLLLMIVTLMIGAGRHRDARALQRAADEDARQVWLNQSDKDAHMAGHYGTYVFKPRPPLSFFDRGLEPHLGVAVFLEAHRQNTPIFPPSQDASGMRRFGEPTAALVLQVVVPLLIIVLSYSSFSGEREQGTLRLVASLGVRPRQLILGKALGITSGSFASTIAINLVTTVGWPGSRPMEATDVPPQD